MRSRQAWRILPAFLLLLALTVPVLPAMAQDAGSILSVDTPSDGQTNELGQDVVFIGWAAHRLGAGSGVDRVMVLDAPMAAGGIVVAEATYGLVRADVGTAYIPSWANSGFRATWRAVGSTGNRTFWVYAHSVDNDGWTNKTVTIRETEASVPAPAPVAAAPSQTTNQTVNQNGQYRNQNGLFGGACDQWGVPYNNQFGNQYNNQYMNQNSQSCTQNSQSYNQNGQYYNQNGQSYNTQYPNQWDPNGLYGNGQYQCDQYGNPMVSYNNFNTNQYNSQYPNYGNNMGYACSGSPSITGSGSLVVGTTAPDGTIAITWTPVASATQGYRVWMMAPNNYLAAILSQSYGSTASATIGGLNPSSSVTFQVRAVSGNVETAIASYWTNTPTVATVAPPLGLTVGTKTSNTVALTWTPSTTGSISSYLVQQTSFSGGTFAPSIVTSLTSSSALVTGLNPNTMYYFEVTAVSAGGLSSVPSASVPAQTMPSTI
jgi:hypothetical protein